MSVQKITHKSGVRYRARIRDERGRQVSKTFRRKYDAEVWEREQLRLRERPDLRPDPVTEMTFGELSQEWLLARRSHLTQGSWVNYETALRRHVYPWIEEQLVSDLSLDDWDQWFAEICENEEWSIRTINHALVMVGTIVRWARKRYGPILNPRDHIDQLPQPEQGFDFWSDGEVEAFLECAEDHHLGNFFKVALNTGMRRGELIALRWDALSFERNQITVRRSFCGRTCKVRETTKGRRHRTLPMGSSVRRALAEQKLSGTKPWVFSGPQGKMLQPCTLQRNFRALCDQADVRRVRFHDLRHTYASHFMMNGGDLFTLQHLLGHKDITTTQRYAHLSPEHLQQAAGVVDFGAAKEAGEVLLMEIAPKR